MPLPTPRNNEKRGDFMGRCVSDLTEKGEFNDNKQRVAVCLNIFKDAESKASVVFDDGEDTTLFFTEAANENKGAPTEEQVQRAKGSETEPETEPKPKPKGG